MDANQSHPIEWRTGNLPVSLRFDDPYFSLDDGLAETRHVFLEGNGLPERFAPGFHIAELGFGTGLNLLATLHLWRAAGIGGRLRFSTFEAFPLPAEAMQRAHLAFPELADLSRELTPLWENGPGRITLPDLEFHLIPGDARDSLPKWPDQADAWFLDGFSPARNPELWTPDLLAEVARHTAPDGTAATYTAAGAVRRALSDAGFTVERVAGFGRKRHMTRCRKDPAL